MSRQSELREHIEGVLDDLMVARPFVFTIANNAHQQVEFTHHGIKVKYQFPGSYSDRRVFENVRASIKKRLRTTEGLALSGNAARRSVLDAAGLLPCQSHHVGTGRAGVPQAQTPVRHSGTSRHCKTS